MYFKISCLHYFSPSVYKFTKATEIMASSWLELTEHSHASDFKQNLCIF